MQESKIRFGALSASEQARLSAVYGPQPENGYAARRIAYVRALNGYEAWFFGRGNFLSPGFLTQTLYKLKGTLSPLRFTRALHELDMQEDMLRTNYCDAGGRVLAVICEERKNVELVVYNNLQGREPEDVDAVLRKSATAALHYPFDVEKGGLLRILVFHTGKDEYAVLVTAAQILMDRFDVRRIFRAAMGQPAGPRREVPPPLRNVQMEAKMREYWKNLLAAPPRPAPLPWELKNVPPHPYRQRTCRVVFPGSLFSDLLAAAKGNRLMLMASMATAWSLLLQTEGQRKDICFCLIAPNRGARESGMWHPFQMVPVRQTLAQEETVDALVRRQFQQLLVSKPYACFDCESFGDFLGGDKPFDHFLDFYDFLSEDKPYSDQDAALDGNVVYQHSWDAQSMKLSLYFRYTETSASVILLYDEKSFAQGAGDRITQSYLLALEQMLTDRHQSVAVFQEHLLERLHAQTMLRTAYRQEEKARLQHAVSSIRFLQGTDVGTTQTFMQEGTLRTYFEGDRVEDMGRDLLFVVEGKLARSIQDSDGWYCTLNIAKDGAWLNENVMLDAPKAALAAEVLSERATILAVPKKTMQTILNRYPGNWQTIANHAIAQLENYQRLWAQS
ncbi:MAG: hypothetical protein IJ521_09385 [Schwartzia sp.]|nr:hypothetical protein [Schwartzia sp. (in: firmicutes)]